MKERIMFQGSCRRLMHDHDRRECVNMDLARYQNRKDCRTLVIRSHGASSTFSFARSALSSLVFPEPPAFWHGAIGIRSEAINCSLRFDFCRRSLFYLSRTLLRAVALAVETGNS